MLKISRFYAKRYGYPRYFTGKPCTRGHIAERRTDNWSCTECNRENARASNTDNSALVEVRVRVPAEHAKTIHDIAADFRKENKKPA